MTGSRAIWFVALTVIFVACVLEEEFRAMPEEERRTSVEDEPDWHLHCLLSPFGDVPSLRQLEQSLEDWSRRRTKASLRRPMESSSGATTPPAGRSRGVSPISIRSSASASFRPPSSSVAAAVMSGNT